jgi:signal transduction histidine kinase
VNRPSLGIQWRLTLLAVGVSLAAIFAVLAAFAWGRTAQGQTEAGALLLGAGTGLLVLLVGVFFLFQFLRSWKFRLWEAGEMAGRLAAGEWGARLVVWAGDELGELETRLNQMGAALEEAVGDLKRLAEQNQELAAEVAHGAALAERAKLALDLHDGICQQLFVLAMRASALQKRLAMLRAHQDGEQMQGLAAEAKTLAELAREAHGEARHLMLQLRPTPLAEQGLGPALVAYAQTAAAKAGWQLHLAVDTSVRLKGARAEGLFRAAQEALHNAAKHAQAQNLWLELSVQVDEAAGGRSLLLRVKDDGVGFDARAGWRPSAVGLLGMGERIEKLGGETRLRSKPGQGTEIMITLPLGEDEEGLE